MALIADSKKLRRTVKFCPKCNGEMGLLWNNRKRSENAYSPELVHQLICVNCGFSRTERFIDLNSYPVLIQYNKNGILEFILNDEKDTLTRIVDAATIATSE